MHNLLGVFETLGEVRVVSNEFVVEVESLAITILVDIRDKSLVGR